MKEKDEQIRTLKIIDNLCDSINYLRDIVILNKNDIAILKKTLKQKGE